MLSNFTTITVLKVLELSKSFSSKIYKLKYMVEIREMNLKM